MKPVAQSDFVIIESFPKKAGDEIFENGIFTGYRETGEVPLTATVISIGANVPAELNGATVLLPHGGKMENVPDHRVVKGEIKAGEGRNMCVTHYKNITVVYE